MHNQFLLTELIKQQMRAEQEVKDQDAVRKNLPNRKRNQKMTLCAKVPKWVRGLVGIGLFGAAATGFPAFLNYVYNHNQVYTLSNGVTQYKKMDGIIYAHTILTKGDPKHGKDYRKLERITLQESRTYMDFDGDGKVDDYTLKSGLLGDIPTLNYKREKDYEVDGELFKNELFLRADAVIKAQYSRFKPLVNAYFPNRLSR